jgi:hypothetical protein
MAVLPCDENAARVRESAGLEAHDHALAATVEVTQDRLPRKNEAERRTNRERDNQNPKST